MVWYKTSPLVFNLNLRFKMKYLINTLIEKEFAQEKHYLIFVKSDKYQNFQTGVQICSPT